VQPIVREGYIVYGEVEGSAVYETAVLAWETATPGDIESADMDIVI